MYFLTDRSSRRIYVGLICTSLILIVLLFLASACDPDDPTPEPTSGQPDNSNGNTNNQTGSADLTLSNVSITGIDPQSGSPYYMVEGTVRNNGNADASGFEAGCTYQCPGGTITSGGFSLVQGGFVSANSSFTYTASNRIACEPVPAILMNVTCEVDENNDVAESNENNNSLNIGNLSVP